MATYLLWQPAEPTDQCHLRLPRTERIEPGSEVDVDGTARRVNIPVLRSGDPDVAGPPSGLEDASTADVVLVRQEDAAP
jgi:hypothetical protein